MTLTRDSIFDCNSCIIAQFICGCGPDIAEGFRRATGFESIPQRAEDYIDEVIQDGTYQFDPADFSLEMAGRYALERYLDEIGYFDDDDDSDDDSDDDTE